ncbi:MAG: alpha/beta fold hydrolase [Betaproteobacteria bacterium]
MNSDSTSVSPRPSPWIEHIEGNMVWSNAILVTKGMAPYGAVALGEIDQVCEKLRLRQKEESAWWEEWQEMADRLKNRADSLEKAGHRLSAGNLYLRAGMYYFTAERFIYPGPEKRLMGQKAIENQTRGIVRRYPNVERVEVPFEGGTLPALFLKSTTTHDQPVPTIVVFNGMDNCKEMSVLFSGLEFCARGWNTLAIDGPGQGESLRLRDLFARHDYEKAGTAAFDYLLTRKEVLAEKIFVMGYSFGGYYATRVAAFEKRYCGAIAMSALHWDLHGWQRDILRRQQANPKGTPQSAFHFRWIMGCIEDAEAALEKAKKFSLQSVVQQIQCPFVIVHASDDTVVPVANAHQLYDSLTTKDKTLKILDSHEGGHYHAQADNRQVGIDFIADWIEDQLISNKKI